MFSFAEAGQMAKRGKKAFKDGKPAPGVTCPCCARRGSLKEKHGVMDQWERYTVVSWQCIYCGTTCEPHSAGWTITGQERVILCPGELEWLRGERNDKSA